MKFRILLSEDDQTITKYWKSSLEKEGVYQVDVAHDGEKALEYWGKNPYDLVVLDLLTPKVKGGEILDRIKSRQPWSQVIIVSGQGKEKDKLNALKKHVFDYLEKPASLKDLKETIRRALEGRDFFIRTVELLVRESPDPNQPSIVMENQAVSPQKLYDEIRMGLELGKQYRQYLEEKIKQEVTEPVIRTGFREGGIIE